MREGLPWNTSDKNYKKWFSWGWGQVGEALSERMVRIHRGNVHSVFTVNRLCSTVIYDSRDKELTIQPKL